MYIYIYMYCIFHRQIIGTQWETKVIYNEVSTKDSGLQ